MKDKRVGWFSLLRVNDCFIAHRQSEAYPRIGTIVQIFPNGRMMAWISGKSIVFNADGSERGTRKTYERLSMHPIGWRPWKARQEGQG